MGKGHLKKSKGKEQEEQGWDRTSEVHVSFEITLVTKQ